MEPLAIVVKTAGTAVRFVEGGPLADALAELNLAAARSALVNAERAVDKRGQVWSAINHLEGALAALNSKVQGGRGKAHFVARPHNWYLLSTKRQYVLALIAICYRYLGEENLAQHAVNLGRAEIEQPFNPFNPLPYLAILVTSFNPVDMLRGEDCEVKYRVDWKQFELPPRGLTSPGGDTISGP